MCHQKKNYQRIWLLLILVFLLTACGPDDPPGTPDVYDVDCSEGALISAINQANNSPGPSVINLDYCIYSLDEVDNSQSFSGLTINNGLPLISSEITINGNSAVIKIQPASGEPDFGHFLVNAMGDLTINDLRLQYGYRPIGGAVIILGGDFSASGVEFVDNMADGDGPNSPALGGAIYSIGGQVHVTNNSIFLSNQAGVPRAGIENHGGAIYNKDGALIVIDSTFTYNKAASDGEAIYSIKSASHTGGGTITIENADFEENEAETNGGGVALVKEVEGVYLTNSHFELNEAGYGGALYSEDSNISAVYTDFVNNDAWYGGAVFSKRSEEGVLSQTSIEYSDLYQNSANTRGGSVFSENSDLVIEDSTIRWSSANSCAGIQNGGIPSHSADYGYLETTPRISPTSEIRDSTFEYNNTPVMVGADGGALCHLMGDLRISGSYFGYNRAGYYGGGLLVLDDLEMIDSQIEGSHATNGGGMSVGAYTMNAGIDVDITDSRFNSNFVRTTTSGSGGFGGGLLVFSDGTTTINKTTFERNWAEGGGGGIQQSLGQLYLTNSTLPSKRGYGGGIPVYGGNQPVVTGLHHVTVASSYTYGISTSETVNLSIYKSLFHNNAGGAVDLSASTFLNAGGNVIDSGPSALGTTFPAGSPMIGPLVGSTHPVLAGSPLIDFLSSCGEPEDQRTVVRPQGTGCEPGAYEYNGEDDISSNLPDFPQFESDFGDSSDECNPFAGLAPELLTLGLPENTMNLPVVVRIDGVFPGLDSEGNALSEFSATLGDLQAYQCTSQGFPDRIICIFKMPDHSPGMVLDYALSWDDCGDPIFTMPLVSIPDLQSDDSTSDDESTSANCTVGLEGDACTAAGGTPGRSECNCP